MDSVCFLLSFLLLFCNFPLSLQDDVMVSIKAVTTIAKTDDNFVCVTLDWWPPEKCNYGWCPWGEASVLNLDLENTILFNAIQAFKSLRIRVGGSLQDQIEYKVGDKPPKCQRLKKDETGLFGFSKGCLTKCRWDDVNDLFNKTGAVVTFGLNALYGRRKLSDNGAWAGNWDPSNTRDFMNYTLSKGYKIESWELGNELSGEGVSAKVDAKQYGEDLIVLKSLIDELYQNSSTKPKVLAPGGFFDQEWFSQMLQTSGPGVIDIVTHHIYNLGPGNDKGLINHVQDPYYLDKVAQTYSDVENTLKNFGPWASAWVGESGGAYNSGGKGVSHTYVDSFWYLDQLGMTSTFDHKAFCRQALIGGNYGLLKKETFVPNPDYYGALLWHRLMGAGVLSTNHNASAYLRAYSHCSKGEAGVTLLLINMSNSTAYDVSVVADLNLYPPQLTRYTKMSEQAQGQREEYHLTPEGGNIQSEVVLLNGQPLNVTDTGEIPEMYPYIIDASAPLHIAPQAIAFVRFKDIKAPACSS